MGYIFGLKQLLLHPKPLTLSPTTFPNAIVGQPYQITITAYSFNGQPASVKNIDILKGTLAPGLNIQFDKTAQDAVISGTPQEEGIFSFTILATGYFTNFAGPEGQQDYEILVSPALPEPTATKASLQFMKRPKGNLVIY